MIVALLGALVPILVRQAESLFDGKKRGQEKHAWVEGFVLEFFEKLSDLPFWHRFRFLSFLTPAQSVLKQAIAEAIYQALEKMEK